MDFGEKYQDIVLSMCLKDASYLRACMRVCEAEHFTGKVRGWVWRAVVAHWGKHKETMGAKFLAEKAKTDFPKKEVRAPYVLLAQRLGKLKPKRPKTVLENIEAFVEEGDIKNIVSDAVEDLGAKSNEEIKSKMLAGLKKRRGRQDYSVVSIVDEFQERLERSRKENDSKTRIIRMPIGIRTIDMALNGGGERGDLAIIMGATNMGKSSMLVNCAQANAQRGKNVIYFSFEMSAYRVASRIDARWMGLPLKSFKNHSWRPSDIRYMERKLGRAKRTGHMRDLTVISFPIGKARMDDVARAIAEVEEQRRFRADVIILDSADHLKPFESFRGDYRLQQAENYRNAKALAEEEGYFVVSATQAGREYANKLAGAEAASESYDKARYADIALSINDPEKIAARGRRGTVVVDHETDKDETVDDDAAADDETTIKFKEMLIYLSKNREGQKNVMATVDYDFATMRLRDITKDGQNEEDDVR